MRDIKFRYVWQNGSNIVLEYWNIKLIETGIVHKENEYLKLLSRDLFTGLKDKNGKEIYEGDIVESDDLILIVEYISGAFTLCIDNSNFVILSPEKLKVIGNIHQNKDLLND